MDVANREVRNRANKKEEFVHSATENNFSQSSNKKAQIEENIPTANTCDVLNNKGDIFLEKKPLTRIWAAKATAQPRTSISPMFN